MIRPPSHTHSLDQILTTTPDMHGCQERSPLFQLLQPKPAPVQPLGPSPVPVDLGSTPRAREVVDAFPFSVSAGSKAKHMPETQTDTEHWHDWSHRLPQQMAAFNSSYTQDSHEREKDREMLERVQCRAMRIKEVEQAEGAGPL